MIFSRMGLDERCTPKPPPYRFSELSTSRQLLLRLCQPVNFGCIRDLEIRDSETVFIPPPLVLMDVKLDAVEAVRPEIQLADFALCQEVYRFRIAGQA